MLGAWLWKWHFDPRCCLWEELCRCGSDVNSGSSGAVREPSCRCNICCSPLITWALLLTQVCERWFIGWGRDTKPAPSPDPAASSFQLSTHHSSPAQTTIQSIQPSSSVPPFPTLLPTRYAELRSCQLLPDVLLTLGAGRRFLQPPCTPLARVYACSSSSEGCGWLRLYRSSRGLGWGQEPDCVSDAVAQCDLYPSFHRAPCWSLRGQQVPARRTPSPLLRGGNISCQDLSSPGCSLELEMAAADALSFLAPHVRVLPACSQMCPFQKLLSRRCWGG